MAVRGVNLFVGAQLVSGDTFCPTLTDFDVAYGDVMVESNGWRVFGDGGVYGKTSFNLLGGYVEFDMDVCGAKPGVNSNFYLISPEGGLSSSGYCDIQDMSSPTTCMELDLVESNGQCLGQTTWHIWADHEGGCDQSGCAGQSHYEDGCKFHMRTEFGEDGTLTQYRNGQIIKISGLGTREKNELKKTMERAGSAITSTQWVGWVPDDGSCDQGGDLEASHFAVTNVRVYAPKGITFGPTPSACAEPWPPSPPPSPPTPPKNESYYCPTLEDFDVAYGNVTAEDNGWRVYGAGGVHGRTSWNLLGGSVSFDMDVCGTEPGINSNFYMISPEGGPATGYCDIQSDNDSPMCMELDMVENNGQCLGRTTWHVWGGHQGESRCDQWGCYGQFHLDDGCKFHMKTKIDDAGSITQYRNGEVVQIAGLESHEKHAIQMTMLTAGASIASTQWMGWVPDDGSCGGGGNLDAAQFAVTNVVVHAPNGIKFGPVPAMCENQNPSLIAV